MKLKKLISVMLIGACVCSMAACGSKKEEKKIPECSGTKHFLEVGNTGKWFNSKAEAVNYFDTTYSYWAKKWENLEIDDATFYKNCPTRYEVFQCICGKWTMNFFYD